MTAEPARRMSRVLRRAPAVTAAALLFALLCAAALLAPLLSVQNPYDPAQLDLAYARLPPGSPGPGGIRFLLGTDDQGRDLLAAILYGLRTSIWVGFASTFAALALGGTAGIAAAWARGRTEAALMRLADLQLSFPSVLVALVLIAALGQGTSRVVAAVVVAQWAYFARSVRGTALVELSKDYIAAARGLALPTLRIAIRHLAPNCLPPLLVVASVQMAAAIVLEATLSFLGLGVPATRPSLGLLVANGQPYLLAGEYWMSLFPGLALMGLIVAINAAAEGIRAALDPRAEAGGTETPA